jgi:hypothetical protein
MNVNRHTLYILLIPSLFMVVGCSRKVVPATHEVRDSVHVSIEYRDVAVPVPGDTVEVTEYLECDSLTKKPKPVNIKAKATKAFVNIIIDDHGKMSVTGGCDSLIAIVKSMEKQILKLKHEKKTVIQEVRKLRWYDHAAHYISLVTLVCFAALVIYALIKLKLP